ncbi:OpgC domain-containing protein [Zavarzinia compransoris]|uniref:OpgC domain-containing protein n=1 Tax=Zavarzinia marina TaxID=2911065 RepID=UPI001F33A770|nr:OpgC domain-containing protein [Zavarzinia marina]MCF4164146.1 OpgC domain-containing protein [Zavarzinia marina]
MAATAKRIAVIDGLRGYFLVMMMSSHLIFQGGAMMLHLHHGELAFVEDAQGFVFLSGLVVGLTYCRILDRKGPAALTSKAWTRVGELYRLLLLTLAAVILAALVLPDGDRIWGWQLGLLGTAPLDHLGIAAALLYQPAYLDILPQYMIYLIAAPFIVRWTAAGHGPTIVAGSLALWMAAQVGLHLPVVAGLEAAVQSVDSGAALRSYFNPLGWQLLFVTGAVTGAAFQSGRLDLQRIFGRERLGLALIALGFAAVFAGIRIAHGIGLEGDLADRFYRLLRREDLSLVYVLNFAALGYGVGYLIANADTREVPRVLAMAGSGLRRFFAFPFFAFLGKHSLQVYAFHVLVAYAVVALQWYWGPFDEWTKSALVVAAWASLGIPATWHHLSQRREQARAAVLA